MLVVNSNRLREYRKYVGMPVSELARRAKTSRETITGIELHGQVPNGLLMLRICNALRVDPREIFFDSSAIHGLQEARVNDQ